MKAQWPLYQATPMVATSPNGSFIKAAALSSYPNGHSPNGRFINATLSASSMATLSGFQGPPPLRT